MFGGGRKENLSFVLPKSDERTSKGNFSFIHKKAPMSLNNTPKIDIESYSKPKVEDTTPITSKAVSEKSSQSIIKFNAMNISKAKKNPKLNASKRNSPVKKKPNVNYLEKNKVDIKSIKIPRAKSI